MDECAVAVAHAFRLGMSAGAFVALVGCFVFPMMLAALRGRR